MASIRRKTYRAKDGSMRRSAKWSIRYRDADGIVHEVAGFKDKEATRQHAAKLERDAELGRAGVRDPFAKHRNRPVKQHLADFEAHLIAKGNERSHVAQTCRELRRAAEACKWTFCQDITGGGLQAHLGGLREAGKSPRTCNYLLGAVKSFCRWMVKDRRMLESPVAYLRAFNLATDRRRVRRALSDADLAKLLQAARNGRMIGKISGIDRAILYMTAAYTGLRCGELTSLTRESFDLDAVVPTVRVLAGYSKRRREDVLPLHESLVREITPWLAGKPYSCPLWPPKVTRDKGAGRLLRVDLKVADLPYRDDAGRVADFHSLRHTFITRLGRAGVSIQQAKELARHSDVNLTLGVYTHLGIRDAASAVASLPDLPDPPTHPSEELRATGTDSSSRQESFPTLFPIAGDFSRLSVATEGDVEQIEDATQEKQKPLISQGFADENQQVASDCSSASRRTRTDNLMIKSQVAESPKVEFSKNLGQEPSAVAHPIAHRKRKKGFKPSPEMVADEAVRSADPALARIIEAWPTLPAPILRAMLALLDLAQRHVS